MSGAPGTSLAGPDVPVDVAHLSTAPDRPGIVARALVLALRGYQSFVSPLIPPSCRFAPSCSEYAVQALRTHGAVYGAWLTVRRLLRCAPWHPGGWDPVPPRSTPDQRPSERRSLEHRTADMPAEEND